MEVLGVHIPILDQTESGTNPSTVCAVIVQEGVRTGPGLANEVAALDPERRACFITNAMIDCMRFRDRVHSRASKDDAGPRMVALRSKFRRDITKTLEVLMRHGMVVCSKTDLATLRDLLGRWQMSAFAGPPKGLLQ
jgi:hypothetical protein